VNNGCLADKKTREGFVQTRLSVTRLNHIFVEALVEAGVPAVGVSPCALWGDRIFPDSFQLLHRLLNLGLVPVLHGDAIIHSDSAGCSILSGDVIVRDLALAMRPSRVVFLSDVQGIFDRPPTVQGAELLPLIEVDCEGNCAELRKEGNASIRFDAAKHDTTGGMEAKLKDGIKIAKHGIDVLITKAGSPDSLIAMRDCYRPETIFHGTLLRKVL